MLRRIWPKFHFAYCIPNAPFYSRGSTVKKGTVREVILILPLLPAMQRNIGPGDCVLTE